MITSRNNGEVKNRKLISPTYSYNMDIIKNKHESSKRWKEH